MYYMYVTKVDVKMYKSKMHEGKVNILICSHHFFDFWSLFCTSPKVNIKQLYLYIQFILQHIQDIQWKYDSTWSKIK